MNRELFSVAWVVWQAICESGAAKRCMWWHTGVTTRNIESSVVDCGKCCTISFNTDFWGPYSFSPPSGTFEVISQSQRHHQSDMEDLVALWRVAGINLYWKVEKSGGWYLQIIASKHISTEAEWRSSKPSNFLHFFSFYSTSATSLLDGIVHNQGKSLLPQFAGLHANHF